MTGKDDLIPILLIVLFQPAQFYMYTFPCYLLFSPICVLATPIHLTKDHFIHFTLRWISFLRTKQSDNRKVCDACISVYYIYSCREIQFPYSIQKKERDKVSTI